MLLLSPFLSPPSRSPPHSRVQTEVFQFLIESLAFGSPFSSHYGAAGAALLTLICSLALLQRASRDRNEAGAIIATITDNAVVGELVPEVLPKGSRRRCRRRYGKPSMQLRC
jgi:hypothetical protein